MVEKNENIRIVVGFSRPKHHHFPIFSWIIRAVERTKYSHVYVQWHSRGAGLDVTYHASGTQVHFIGPSIFKEKIRVIEEYETFIDRSRYPELLRFCMMNAGVDYGINGVIGMGLGKLLVAVNKLMKKDYEPRNPLASGKTSQWCSKLVGSILTALGKLHLENKRALEMAGPREINRFIRESGDFRKIT